jgi:hypothetical protein
LCSFKRTCAYTHDVNTRLLPKWKKIQKENKIKATTKKKMWFACFFCFGNLHVISREPSVKGPRAKRIVATVPSVVYARAIAFFPAIAQKILDLLEGQLMLFFYLFQKATWRLYINLG